MHYENTFRIENLYLFEILNSSIFNGNVHHSSSKTFLKKKKSFFPLQSSSFSPSCLFCILILFTSYVRQHMKRCCPLLAVACLHFVSKSVRDKPNNRAAKAIFFPLPEIFKLKLRNIKKHQQKFN